MPFLQELKLSIATGITIPVMRISPTTALLSATLLAALTVSAIRPSEEEVVTTIEMRQSWRDANAKDLISCGSSVRIHSSQSGFSFLSPYTLNFWLQNPETSAAERSRVARYGVDFNSQWKRAVDSEASTHPEIVAHYGMLGDLIREWAVKSGGTMTDLEFDPDGTRIEIWTVRQNT